MKYFCTVCLFLLVLHAPNCQAPPDHNPPIAPPPPDDIIPPDDTTTSIPDDCTRFVATARVGQDAAGDYTLNCDGSTGLLAELCIARQDLIWDGYRNPAFAVNNCPDELSTIELTPQELGSFVEEGGDLLGALDRFYRRLQEPNPACPGKTVVNKEFFKNFRTRLADHMALAGYFNHQTQQDPCRKSFSYDNLRGWCERCYNE